MTRKETMATDILGPILYVQTHDEEGNEHWPESMTTCADRINETDVEYVRADIAQTMSDQLVDAHEIVDELLRERDELRAELLRLRALVEGE